jgi:hypothetical protein
MGFKSSLSWTACFSVKFNELDGAPDTQKGVAIQGYGFERTTMKKPAPALAGAGVSDQVSFVNQS